ncbi:MAG TPA: nitronate monooxygenase [Acidimicrobiia bacterium]
MLDLAALRRPVVQAPMAGGPGTVELAAAVVASGGLGFLAAGYATAAAVRGEVDELRRLVDGPFGVNVFVPEQTTPDPAALDRYRAELEPEAERLGTTVGEPVGGDDDWDEKVVALLELRVPLVSFTFGCPPASVVGALRATGTTVVVTVTSPDEARIATQAGADALCAQGVEAGAHRGSFVNQGPAGAGSDLLTLLREVRTVTDRALIAAGAIARREDAEAALAAGAVAVQAGTAFLLCPESGTNPVHRAALTERRDRPTVLSRAFTGRPARGIVNRFVDEHAARAPSAYPHVHQITRPIRRAALARPDPECVNLWAGTRLGFVRERPAAEVVEDLSPARG